MLRGNICLSRSRDSPGRAEQIRLDVEFKDCCKKVVTFHISGFSFIMWSPWSAVKKSVGGSYISLLFVCGYHSMEKSYDGFETESCRIKILNCEPSLFSGNEIYLLLFFATFSALGIN